MTRRTVPLLVLVCGAVLALAVGGFLWWQKRPKAPAWVTQKVLRGDVAQVVSATGVVQPVTLSPVGSQVSGIVWKIHADYNDPVKKGQVLLELDPALLNAAVAREEANLGSAQADVRKTQAGLQNTTLIAERAQALAEKHYIATADRDTALAQKRQAEADVAGAQARVKQAQAAVERSRLDLRNSVIRSPVDGVVIARNVELGQAVAAQFQAPNLFTIAEDLRRMQVLANVDEADIGGIRMGQVANFTVDAYRGRRFSAEVAQVRSAAQTVQNVVTYVVVLNVDNSDLLLKPGMTANVRMDIARREGVLLLPNAALRFKPRTEGGAPGAGPQRQKGDRQAAAPGRAAPAGPGRAGERGREGTRGTAYVSTGETLRPVPVTTGITDGTVTELLSGLGEGDEVVVDAARATSSGPASPGGPFSPPARGGGMRRGGF